MLDKPYVIHARRPYRCVLILLLVIASLLGAGWFWSQEWRLAQSDKLRTLQGQYKQLVSENERLTSENQQLATELENITQMQALQQATDSKLQDELQAMQEQVIALNKELLFYQNITQGNASSELQVRELHLRPVADDPAAFMYRIVLTQGKRITKAIKGDVLITLNLGSDDEAHSRLLDQHDLKIRHVQVLEGTLRLTENEQPESLRIMLRQSDKTLTERTFKWEVSPSPAP
jgi:regulator of replication initiation timing